MKEWAHDQGCDTYEELAVKLGKNWGYQFHQYVSYLRTVDRLGIAPPSDAEEPVGMTTPGGRFSGRSGGVELNEPQAGRASGPISGDGSAGAGGACDDSRGRPAPWSSAGWVPNMPQAGSQYCPSGPC